MTLALDLISWACLLIGAAFVVIGGIGLIRMPDFYTRTHPAGLTDTLGAGLILVGLMIESGWSLNLAKLAMILIFLLFTSPTASHALAHAALVSGLKPWTRPGGDSEQDRSKT